MTAYMSTMAQEFSIDFWAWMDAERGNTFQHDHAGGAHALWEHGPPTWAEFLSAAVALVPALVDRRPETGDSLARRLRFEKLEGILRL